jgi:hypothetical protein
MHAYGVTNALAFGAILADFPLVRAGGPSGGSPDVCPNEATGEDADPAERSRDFTEI